MGCGLDLCLNAYSSSATSLTTEGEKARAPQTRWKVNVTVKSERSSTPEMPIASFCRRYASIVGKIKSNPKNQKCNVHSDRHALQIQIFQPPRLRVPWRDLPVDVDGPLRLPDLPMRHRQGPTEVLHPHGHPLRELLFLLRGEAERAEPARLAHGLGDRASRVDPARNERVLGSDKCTCGREEIRKHTLRERRLCTLEESEGISTSGLRGTIDRNARATHILSRACLTRCISCSPVELRPFDTAVRLAV